MLRAFSFFVLLLSSYASLKAQSYDSCSVNVSIYMDVSYSMFNLVDGSDSEFSRLTKHLANDAILNQDLFKDGYRLSLNRFHLDVDKFNQISEPVYQLNSSNRRTISQTLNRVAKIPSDDLVSLNSDLIYGQEVNCKGDKRNYPDFGKSFESILNDLESRPLSKQANFVMLYTDFLMTPCGADSKSAAAKERFDKKRDYLNTFLKNNAARIKKNKIYFLLMDLYGSGNDSQYRVINDILEANPQNEEVYKRIRLNETDLAGSLEKVSKLITIEPELKADIIFNKTSPLMDISMVNRNCEAILINDLKIESVYSDSIEYMGPQSIDSNFSVHGGQSKSMSPKLKTTNAYKSLNGPPKEEVFIKYSYSFNGRSIKNTMSIGRPTDERTIKVNSERIYCYTKFGISRLDRIRLQVQIISNSWSDETIKVRVLSQGKSLKCLGDSIVILKSDSPIVDYNGWFDISAISVEKHEFSAEIIYEDTDKVEYSKDTVFVEEKGGSKSIIFPAIILGLSLLLFFISKRTELNSPKGLLIGGVAGNSASEVINHVLSGFLNLTGSWFAFAAVDYNQGRLDFCMFLISISILIPGAENSVSFLTQRFSGNKFRKLETNVEEQFEMVSLYDRQFSYTFILYCITAVIISLPISQAIKYIFLQFL